MGLSYNDGGKLCINIGPLASARILDILLHNKVYSYILGALFRSSDIF